MAEAGLTDERLGELERLAAAATPGPWRNDPEPGMPWDIGRAKLPGDWDPGVPCLWLLATTNVRLGNTDDAPMAGDYRFGQAIADAWFIAAARTAVPELCAEVRRLRAALAGAEGLRDLLRESGRAVVAGMEAERERCAKVAEGHWDRCGRDCWNHRGQSCHTEIAAAIREGG